MLKMTEEGKLTLYHAILHYGHLEFMAGLEAEHKGMENNEEYEKLVDERAKSILNIKKLIATMLDIET